MNLLCGCGCECVCSRTRFFVGVIHTHNCFSTCESVRLCVFSFLYSLKKVVLALIQPLGTSEILHLSGDCLLFSHACNYSNEKGIKMWRGKYPTRIYDLIWHNISVF